jgi:hypothetical protein
MMLSIIDMAEAGQCECHVSLWATALQSQKSAHYVRYRAYRAAFIRYVRFIDR